MIGATIGSIHEQPFQRLTVQIRTISQSALYLWLTFLRSSIKCVLHMPRYAQCYGVYCYENGIINMPVTFLCVVLVTILAR